MKKTLILTATLALAFTACGPTAESILKKYEGYPPVSSSDNGLGVKFFEHPMAGTTFIFTKTSDYLSAPKENFHEVKANMKNIVSERFVIFDAKNPSKLTGIDFQTLDGLGYSNSGHPALIEVMLLIDEAPQFVLVGFKGVRESESARWSTPPLFFLFENIDDRLHLLTSEPLLAGDLFNTASPEAQFIEAQPVIPVIRSEHEDKINLGGGKTLSISFSLSKKGSDQTITECKISVETSVRNANGSTSVSGSNYFGYDIEVGPDGTFNHTISDYSVNGKVNGARITGSIKSGRSNYSYSAKQKGPGSGNPGIYKSIESTNVR